METDKHGRSSVQNVSYLSRTDGLTEFASDASLLSIGISAKSMLSSKAWTKWPLFKWVHQGNRLTEEGRQSDCKACGREIWLCLSNSLRGK